MRTFLRALNFFLGLFLIGAGLFIFGIFGTIVDGVSLTTFFKGMALGCVCFGFGALMYWLGGKE